MPLYTSQLLPSPSPTAPTSNRFFPPPRRATCPSSSLRRRFSSESKPHLPLSLESLHSARVFRKPNLQCTSSLSMAADESTSTSQGSLLYSRAFWVSESIIAWNVDVGNGSCYLFASKTAALSFTSDGIIGEDIKVKLEEDKHGLPKNVKEKFPHIKDYRAFNVPLDLVAKPLLKFQLAVATFSSDGRYSNATGLQLPGILDELFSYNGPLGALYSKESVSLYLWAPTAQEVCVCIYKEPSGGNALEVVQLEEVNGVWSTTGPKTWEACYYVYQVSVYHPSTLQIAKCYANDPYARGLSSDGRRTLLVNLDSDNVKPEGWDNLVDEKPDIHSFSDISIYELHIRDFSASDLTVHPEFRGGYLAFTLQDSAGVIHLKKLSNAGITHVHLLPAFQFADVDDDKENWKSVEYHAGVM